jgi:hypothetical protein
MKLKSILSFLIISLLLAACGFPMPTMVPGVTENPTIPPTHSSVPTQSGAPTQTSAPTPYPAPIGSPVPTSPAYPEPGTPGTGSPLIPPSGYEPQPGDDTLKRDQVFLDVASSQLVVIASQPAQAKAVLAGNMSDPCHFLRVVVTPPDTSNTLNIEVYTLVDSKTGCITVLKPFTASIPLGSYSSGQYTVMVNGQKLGQFVTTFTPQAGDDKLTRGDVTLDMTASRLIISGMQPNEVSADLNGFLPDPCHQLRIKLTPADAQNKIVLDVSSVFDSKTTCTKVIQPFQVVYPLGSFSSGHYSVIVNGELMGEFNG